MRSNEEFKQEVFARGRARRETIQRRRRTLMGLSGGLCACLALTLILPRVTADEIPNVDEYQIQDDGLKTAGGDLTYGAGSTKASLYSATVVPSTPSGGGEDDYRMPSSVSWVNWSEEGEAVLWDMSASAGQQTDAEARYPVVRLDTRGELDAFLAAMKPYFSLDAGRDGSTPFRTLAAQYTEAYFADGCLLVVYVPSGSGSIRHRVDSVTGTGNMLTVAVASEVPEIGTCDMAGWFITLEAKRSIVDRYVCVTAQ